MVQLRKRTVHAHSEQAHLVVVQEGLALHELVVLVDASVEEVTDGCVVGQHEPAHTVGGGQVWGLLGQRHLGVMSTFW